MTACDHAHADAEPDLAVASCELGPDEVARLASLHQRLAERIAADTGGVPVVPEAARWEAPAWQEVAPGISCQLLATDRARNRVSMLVRLAPGAEFPPRTHDGVEELHVLDGELWIDDRLLHAGDFNRAEPGTSDRRVYSETGCTCVVITSPRDVVH